MKENGTRNDVVELLTFSSVWSFSTSSLRRSKTIAMAGGLIASPNAKSRLIFASIFRTGLLSKYAKQRLYSSPSVSTLLLKRLPVAPSSTRFLCSCSQSHQHGPEKDMSRYKETFARRMEMAGLKPHHRLGYPRSLSLSHAS